MNFPSFNFPYAVDGDQNESFVDYGSSSALNIDVDDAGGLIFQGKLPYRMDKPPWRVISRQPSTPCLPPNELSPIADERLEDLETKKGTCRVQEHSCNFSSDFADVMYGVTLELLHEEFDQSPWNSCSKLSTDSTSSRDFFVHECMLCRFLKQNLGMMQDSVNKEPLLWLEKLSSDAADIPPQLLESFLKESYEQKIEQLKFDILQGNVLACTETGDGKGVILHPGGPSMEVLNVSSCSCKDGELDVVPQQQFAVNGSVKEVVCASVVQGQTLAAVRSQYHVTFFQGSLQGQPKLKVLESVACTSQTVSVAASPYIPNEAVVVLETGGVYLWQSGDTLQTVHQPDSFMKENPLYKCVYAAHPRCIVLADSSGADLIDFRAGFTSQSTFFSIPSTHVNSFEVVSALQRHPTNSHHYLVATDLSILLLDDRFVQHPVLKWHHHLHDSPQFMDVLCGALPGESVLMISGSQHQETHCYQFSDHEGTLPPRSTSLPWKVSPYSDWLSHINACPVLPVVHDRVTTPLVGICAVPHAAYDGFTVLSMSSVGDLFYQPFVVDYHDNHMIDKTSSGECVQMNPKLTAVCMEWIKAVCEEADLLKLGQPHPKDLFAVDKDTVFQAVASMEEPHVACALCLEGHRNPSSLKEDVLEDITCPRCGLNVRYSRKLIGLQYENHIVTNKRLSANTDVRDVVLCNPEDSKDPLSKNLLRNWVNDDPTPIDLLTGNGEDVNITETSMEEPSPELNTTEMQHDPPSEVNAIIAQGTDSPNEETQNANDTPSIKQEILASPAKRPKKERRKLGHTMGF